MAITIRDFLKQYAEKFPEKIKDGNVKRFIETTNEITFDYADGVITFQEHTYPLFWDPRDQEDWIITGSGGNNGCMLNEADYLFIWAVLLEHEPKFMTFMRDHRFSHEDLMSITISWKSIDQKIGNEEIDVDFTFYEG